jgi:hypothetical protein
MPLAFPNAVRQPQPDRLCTYVVSIAKTKACAGGLRSLAGYLSILGTMGCDVIIFDASPRDVFEENRRILRWIARHIAVRAPFDLVRTAAGLASTEKIIVAREDVRYGPSDLAGVCALLDAHEVVEPQDYLDPLPWWGGIEAGRMLVHRGIEPLPDHGATFGFRRGALRALRGFDATGSSDPARRLAAFGAEICSAFSVFVRRHPPELAEWLRERPRAADDDFAMPVKTTFFLAMLPMAMLLLLAGGARIATGYAGAVAFASIVLALRGRSGATAFFPLRVCLYAPLWVLERSVSVYWALLRRVRFAATEPPPAIVADSSDGRTPSSAHAAQPR